uniref:Prostaglandin reductase 1 n=1 Tax=Timema poppense TaxID=170557 RepID=A0A7R9DG09_TIMPO|nr:unnamed protein product [Timema poppensis]
MTSQMNEHASMSTMVKTKKFVMAKRFVNEPKLDDFAIVEEELSPLSDREILCEAQWWSVDPYMRPAMERYPEGSTMVGLQVAKVLESKHPSFKVGDHVVGFFGWQTLTVANGDKAPISTHLPPYKVPDFEGLPLSLALGVLGRTGNSALFGFVDLCKPKAGEVVVVSGAAGAVGSQVGQIAKILGCKVIGFAGSNEKVKWLKEELGFDEAFNYKTKQVSEALKEAAPEGVDCYFDNVGGEISSDVIYQMNTFGRVSVCGSISSYNIDDKHAIKEASKQSRFIEMYNICTGKIKYQETVTEGFENMPQAFIGTLRGANFGKSIVKA